MRTDSNLESLAISIVACDNFICFASSIQLSIPSMQLWLWPTQNFVSTKLDKPNIIVYNWTLHIAWISWVSFNWFRRMDSDFLYILLFNEIWNCLLWSALATTKFMQISPIWFCLWPPAAVVSGQWNEELSVNPNIINWWIILFRRTNSDQFSR